jgi:hypothetical protein
MISKARTMGINAIVLALLTIALAVHAMYVYRSQETPPDKLPWVPIQAGKTRSFHSQTRDASMYTERTRRTAIISNPDLVVGNKSSTNGSLEWNFLTGICVCPPRKRKICPTIFEVSDGQYVDADSCNVLDGMGTDILDLGDAFTDTCPGVCPPHTYETQDGGNVNSDICDVFDGMGTDVVDFGGAADANVC